EARRRSLDRRFFQIIATAGKSPRLDAILEFLGGVLQGSFYYDSPAWVDNEARYRELLLAEIRAGDVVAAARTSEEHVRSCAAVTVEHLRTRGYWTAPRTRPEARLCRGMTRYGVTRPRGARPSVPTETAREGASRRVGRLVRAGGCWRG
ncbi:FCD domain-containing protein, partial [Parafrankia sp. Ea1.12]|uniref:FCD domain-containing protein n=1 Tax=Parafrankia sp. Ea1.12 TaxID=573499 RepID=UPI001F412623